MVATDTNLLCYADLPLQLGIVFEKHANRVSFVFPRTRWQLVGQVLLAMLGAHLLLCVLGGVSGLALVLIFSEKVMTALQRYLTAADWIRRLSFALPAMRSNRQ